MSDQITNSAVLENDDEMPPWRQVFLYFLMLGFINVGGPVAQISMMYNHMVERRHWLSNDRFVKIMAFCHMLPGPEALQLAIYVGYLKRKIWGGIVAGLTFMLPGAVIITILSWLYVTYGKLPQVNDALHILKPAVLGIIGAGIIKLGRATIKNMVLALLLMGTFLAMWVLGVNFLVLLVVAGFVNLVIEQVVPRLRAATPAAIIGFAAADQSNGPAGSHFLQMAWLFLKTGLFSFGGAYASLAFLQRGAVDQHQWLTAGQLLDGVAISVATPGPFMLFATFVGYMAAGVRGAVIATFFVFLPSFVFVLGGAHYIEQVRNNRTVQTFLAGASAAVVGVILVVSLELLPEALVDFPSIVIAIIAFVLIVWIKVDIAFVAAAAMVIGIGYAALNAIT